uniref:Uncharacterized protein n=1 Tax=Tetranychus urticae TaxID=32264 RepID=T1K3U2_TETUR
MDCAHYYQLQGQLDELEQRFAVQWLLYEMSCPWNCHHQRLDGSHGVLSFDSREGKNRCEPNLPDQSAIARGIHSFLFIFIIIITQYCTLLALVNHSICKNGKSAIRESGIMLITREERKRDSNFNFSFLVID